MLLSTLHPIGIVKSTINQMNGNVSDDMDIVLKIQCYPKELEMHLIDLINSELKFMEVLYPNKVSSMKFHSILLDECITMKKESIISSNSISNNNLPLNLKDKNISQSRIKFTHLFQCVHSLEDGFFKWGLVSLPIICIHLTLPTSLVNCILYSPYITF